MSNKIIYNNVFLVNIVFLYIKIETFFRSMENDIVYILIKNAKILQGGRK